MSQSTNSVKIFTHYIDGDMGRYEGVSPWNVT